MIIRRSMLLTGSRLALAFAMPATAAAQEAAPAAATDTADPPPMVFPAWGFNVADLNTEWARISGSLPGLLAGIGGRLEELGGMRKLPEGMDRQLLDETNAAHASAQAAWQDAGAAFANGDLDGAVDKARAAEGMAQDLVARLGMSAA